MILCLYMLIFGFDRFILGFDSIVFGYLIIFVLLVIDRGDIDVVGIFRWFFFGVVIMEG